MTLLLYLSLMISFHCYTEPLLCLSEYIILSHFHFAFENNLANMKHPPVKILKIIEHEMISFHSGKLESLNEKNRRQKQ